MALLFHLYNKEDHCCQLLFELLEEQRIGLFYNPRIRRYTLLLKASLGLQKLFYCFCCGARLPDDLATEFVFILKQEYNIQEPWKATYEKKIPLEFLGDEWWKKRGC